MRQTTEEPWREDRQRHQTGHPQAVFIGREDPHRLDGLRGEDSIAELCRREGISQGIYYKWSKDFMEAGKRRLAGDTARAATTDEVKDLRREARDLKEVVAEQTLELRLAQKKHDRGMGATTNEVSRIREAGDHPAGRGIASVSASDVGQTGHAPHHILPLV